MLFSCDDAGCMWSKIIASQIAEPPPGGVVFLHLLVPFAERI
jgi:hypothetical protein